MEHIGLLGILANLIVALWVAIAVHQYRKSYHYPFLHFLFFYCVIYFFAVLFGLVALYINLNMQSSLFQERIPILRDVTFLGFSLLEIGLVYCMVRIYLGFKGREFSKSAKVWALTGLSLFVLSYGLKIILSQGFIFRILKSFHGYVFNNVIIFEILALVLILSSGSNEPDRKRIRLRRSFGWIFLSRYIVLTGFFVLFVVFISHADEIIPKAVRYPAALAFVLLCSLAPYLWIKFFFREYADSMLVILEDRAVLEAVFEKYGISRREQEILRLLLDGKSNKEIEEILFISYHTVKNHVYNLFQKIGVKNRYELIHFITKFEKS